MNLEFLGMASNRRCYESPHVVDEFVRSSDLRPPEATIIERYKDRWVSMSMLDIGVGGGRTTRHFAPLMKDYVGIDYSAEMIAVCRKRFEGLIPAESFQQCDARDMGVFDDDTFNFILFSFNGIDYVSYEERKQILREIQRVGGPGSLLFFSTHNIRYLPKLYKFRIPRNPLKLFHEVDRFFRVRRLNGSVAKYADMEYVMVNDGAHSFGLETSYVNFESQWILLERMGFTNLQVYGLMDGKQVDRKELSSRLDPWMYFLCTVS